MHEVLVKRLGDLSLPRKSVVRLTDHPDMTLDVYRGRKTTMQQQQNHFYSIQFYLKELMATPENYNINPNKCPRSNKRPPASLPNIMLD